jgi:eukaryotic-like serine/threonine-protein kinase
MRDEMGGAPGNPGAPLGAGTRVAGFVIEGPLAAGGMGMVYRAWRDGRLFALKLLSITPRNDREMDALRRMNHPNVVGFQGWGLWPDETPRFHVLALEFVEGRPLDVWAREENPSALTLVHQVLLPFALTLVDVHASGVVHRDVKEANILVRSGDGQPVLVDFGAAWLEGAPRLTPRLPPGTPEYRSPELLRFAREWTGEPFEFHPREDLWALGVTFYWLLTRTLPFGDRQGPLTHAILHQTPEAPQRLNPRVPSVLGDVCMRLLCKEPEERYPDARALAQALSDAWSGADRSWREPLFAPLPRPAVMAPPEVAVPVRPGLGRWVRALGLCLLLGLRAPRLEWGAEYPPRQAVSRQELASASTTGEVVDGAEPRTSTPPAPVASATSRKDTEMMTSPKVRTAAKTALLVGATCLGPGCAGLPVRKGLPPSECPPGSYDTYRRLHIGPDAGHPISFEGQDAASNTPIAVEEGPTRLLTLGTWNEIPGYTLLLGELFFGKDRVYGRIDRLRLSNGEELPVCIIIAADDTPKTNGLPMEKGSTSRKALVVNSPWAIVVKRFE